MIYQRNETGAPRRLHYAGVEINIILEFKKKYVQSHSLYKEAGECVEV